MRYEQKPWNKAFPYGFGILVGFFYWRYQNENIEGTWLERFTNRVQNGPYFSYILHMIGSLFIATIIILHHPVENDRESDITTSTTFLLTASQIFMPLGLTLNFIPMCLNRSIRLKAFMTSGFIKPISSLLFIIIPLSGTLILHIVYNRMDGMYTNFRSYLQFSFALLMYLIIISLLLAALVISPLSNAVRVLFDQFLHPNDGQLGDDSDLKKDDTYETIEQSEDEGEDVTDGDEDEVTNSDLLKKKPQGLIEG